MTDEELVAAVESTELSGDQFSHSEHVRVAWWYLRRSLLPEALLRFSIALQRLRRREGRGREISRDGDGGVDADRGGSLVF